MGRDMKLKQHCERIVASGLVVNGGEAMKGFHRFSLNRQHPIVDFIPPSNI